MSSIIDHVFYGTYVGIVAGGFMALGNRITITRNNTRISPLIRDTVFVGMGILFGTSLGLIIGLAHKLLL